MFLTCYSKDKCALFIQTADIQSLSIINPLVNNKMCRDVVHHQFCNTISFQLRGCILYVNAVIYCTTSTFSSKLPRL